MPAPKAFTRFQMNPFQPGNPAVFPLTQEDEIKAQKLERELNKAAVAKNLKAANDLYMKLSFLLSPLNHNHRLLKAKIPLFRIAMDLGPFPELEDNLRKASMQLDWQTPEWLEVNFLLALHFVKKGEFADAKLYISVVLENEHVIPSPVQRKQFHEKVIARLSDEFVIHHLKSRQSGEIDPQKLEIDVLKILVSDRSDDDILVSISDSTPIETARALYLLESFSREKSLAPLALPDMESRKGKIFVGGKLFRAFKSRARAAICDPESPVNKAWKEKGVTSLFGGKSLLAASVASAFNRVDLAIYAIAVPVTALIVKTGIEAVCDATEEDFIS
ncbi:MAG: hypothetical protein EOP88_15610 [Verrucomicrobiaceae bacterium]|nr:MAG: hypothetical protein EOP88_15610 [Verrucomicrobiaceae bacterium]